MLAASQSIGTCSLMVATGATILVPRHIAKFFKLIWRFVYGWQISKWIEETWLEKWHQDSKKNVRHCDITHSAVSNTMQWTRALLFKNNKIYSYGAFLINRFPSLLIKKFSFTFFLFFYQKWTHIFLLVWGQWTLIISWRSSSLP